MCGVIAEIGRRKKNKNSRYSLIIGRREVLKAVYIVSK
jgi:hypothetical protein